MKRVNDIKAYINDSVPKAMGVDYATNIAKVRDDMHGSFNSEIDVTTSKPFFLEFMAKDVSKGNAIKALCEKLNVSLSEVICFGDSLNDQSMFEVVGCAIAMGNANEELKAIADKITLDNDSNGIPAALKHFCNIRHEYTNVVYFIIITMMNDPFDLMPFYYLAVCVHSCFLLIALHKRKLDQQII